MKITDDRNAKFNPENYAAGRCAVEEQDLTDAAFLREKAVALKTAE